MNIRDLMDKVEKFCIIIVPIVYIIADVLSNFIPALENLTDEKGYLIVLSGLMVLIFVHTEHSANEDASIIRSRKIVKDMETLLEKKQEYSEILILAVTGYQYFKAFEESGAKVKNLKLLLRKADDTSNVLLPQNDDAKIEFKNSSRRMVKEWQKLQSRGQIENLEIAYYDFDTTIHFMILDNKYLFYGLLFPKKNYPGTDVLTSYIVGNHFDLGENMINDFLEKWIKIRQFCE